MTDQSDPFKDFICPLFGKLRGGMYPVSWPRRKRREAQGIHVEAALREGFGLQHFVGDLQFFTSDDQRVSVGWADPDAAASGGSDFMHELSSWWKLTFRIIGRSDVGSELNDRDSWMDSLNLFFNLRCVMFFAAISWKVFTLFFFPESTDRLLVHMTWLAGHRHPSSGCGSATRFGDDFLRDFSHR